MVGIELVKEQLAELKTTGPGLVGVFVGGTNGIGEYTARSFVQCADSPQVYIVGRNQEQAKRLITEFKEINANTKAEFIQSDVSLLRNVDKVCEEIKSKENKINLLVLSAGILTTKGRDETTEGLDKKFSLHYYSRLRFTTSLLPLLINGFDQNGKASVLSVLGAGYDGALNYEDLQLKNSYSVSACANHAISMNSLALQHLAVQNPNVRFIHTQPGGVSGTEITRNLPKVLSLGMSVLFGTIARPWVMDVKECGERHAWAGLAAKFPDDNGALLIGPKGEKSVSAKFTERFKQDNAEEKVWTHTNEVFKAICEGDGKY